MADKRLLKQAGHHWSYQPTKPTIRAPFQGIDITPSKSTAQKSLPHVKPWEASSLRIALGRLSIIG
jgi:hypothetical protein